MKKIVKKEKQKKPEITLDKLAQMTVNGFLGMEKRFDKKIRKNLKQYAS